MASSPKWLWSKGRKSVVEAPDSPEIEWTDKGAIYTHTYGGKFVSLLAARPRRGQTITSDSENSVVESVKLSKASGGRGTLTVVSQDTTNIDDPQNTTEGAPTFEIEWVMELQALENHPIFASGEYMLDETARCAVRQWYDGNNVLKRAAYEYEELSEDGQTGTWKKLADLTRKKGAELIVGQLIRKIDSYPVYQPVVRRTRDVRVTAASSSIGTQSAASALATTLGISVPFQISGRPCVYVQTADRYTRSGTRGKWERHEEWTGFLEVTDWLFPAG